VIDLASVNVHIWCGTAFIGSSLLVEDSMGWVLGGCFVEEIEPSDKKFDLMNLNITFNPLGAVIYYLHSLFMPGS